MINDYKRFPDPENLNYINGFSYMSNDDLASFLNVYELSFSLEQIIYIRDYFKNVKKMFPTYNQIFFFDEINKIRKAQKRDYSIYSATAEDGATPILQASKDLLVKRGVIKRSVFGAMPLLFAANIASEYLKQIDCAQSEPLFKPANKNSRMQYYIHTDSDVPLLTYSDLNGNSQTIVSHNTLVMLIPDDADIDYKLYCEQVNEFTSLPEIAPLISNKETIKEPYGIYEVLLKETDGVWVNLANIPEIEKDANGRIIDLNTSIFSCIGRYIFSASNTSIGILNRLAEEYSLKACVFAVKNESLTLTFENIKNPTFSFDFNFLQTISNFKDHHEYIFTDESNAILDDQINVYLTDTSTPIRQTYRAEKILNFGKAITSAAGRGLDNSPHRSAALTIIDAINALISKGVSKDSISLSIHYYLLCGTDDSKELGKNLAAILGAYRSMIELCVSDTDPQISYNSKNRAIVVVSSAKAPIRPVKSLFKNGNTHLYFYKIQYREDGLPDYDKYRTFIKYFYGLIEKENLLSAFAINENLSTAIQNASANTDIEFDLEFNNQSFSRSHGMLFETSKKLSLKIDEFDAIFSKTDANFTRISNDIFYIGCTKEKY